MRPFRYFAFLIVLFAVSASVYGSSTKRFDFGLTLPPNTTCSTVKDCGNCSSVSHCFWCAGSSVCADLTDGTFQNHTCKEGWCQGDACTCSESCTEKIFPCSENIVGIIILLCFYGILLACGAKFISDGSELLLEVLDPGIIGGLLIPALGAVPDAAIVIVSGALGSQESAQENLAVGVGTLAGSTIMLLTIPWCASLFLARTDIRGDESVDNVRSGFSWTKSGTTVDKDTQRGAMIMLFTSVGYLIVQGVAFAYLKDPSGKQAHHTEKWFALAGFVWCLICLIGYFVYQIYSPKLQEKKINAARDRLRVQLALSAFQDNLKTIRENQSSVKQPLINGDIETADEDDTPMKPEMIRNFGLEWRSKAKKEAEGSIQQEGSDEEGEEGEEKAEHATKSRIILEAIFWLCLGTGIVSFFSDPMVDVITDFGEKIHVGAFFVSFTITPFCSNASELISSLIFASKKRKKNSSLTYSALYGAATMNNTMVLGIFFGLICFRELAWTFSAEVVTILFVTLCVALVAVFNKTMQLFWGVIILSLYPFSIFLVWLLESVVGWK